MHYCRSVAKFLLVKKAKSITVSFHSKSEKPKKKNKNSEKLKTQIVP